MGNCEYRQGDSESRDLLFFSCPITGDIRTRFLGHGARRVHPSWNSLSPDGYWCKRKASCFYYPSVIMESIRLCDLAGRNRRIFQGMKESDIRLVQVVFDTVRLRGQAWPRVRHKLPNCMKVSCAFGNSL